MSENFGSNPYAPSSALPGDSYDYGSAAGQPPLASLGDRLVGAIVDGIVVGIPAVFAGMVMGIVLINLFPLDSVAFQVASFVIGLPIGIGLFIAIQGYLLANYGQTVGKRLVNTQIVSDDNRLVPFVPLILKRYIPFWVLGSLPTIGILFVLVNILAIFRGNRKCLHDEIAGTKVIKIV
jgi:uncharacterized RDD family membrane protein YckC